MKEGLQEDFKKQEDFSEGVVRVSVSAAEVRRREMAEFDKELETAKKLIGTVTQLEEDEDL